MNARNFSADDRGNTTRVMACIQLACAATIARRNPTVWMQQNFREETKMKWILWVISSQAIEAAVVCTRSQVLLSFPDIRRDDISYWMGNINWDGFMWMGTIETVCHTPHVRQEWNALPESIDSWDESPRLGWSLSVDFQVPLNECHSCGGSAFYSIILFKCLVPLSLDPTDFVPARESFGPYQVPRQGCSASWNQTR